MDGKAEAFWLDRYADLQLDSRRFDAEYFGDRSFERGRESTTTCWVQLRPHHGPRSLLKFRDDVRTDPGVRILALVHDEASITGFEASVLIVPTIHPCAWFFFHRVSDGDRTNNQSAQYTHDWRHLRNHR